jgi:ABC-2 type transport system permease protein
MSANIYFHELRARMRSVIVWSISLTALLLIYFAIFPGFADQADLINQMMSSFPPMLLEAFGMGRTNLATVVGFYSLIFTFVQLCLAIQAGNYGFGLVSIEESELTADFLLSKPVSRTQVLTSKLLAALTSLTITNAVVWVVTWMAIAAFAGKYPVETSSLLLLLASIVIFQVFFMTVGLVISLLVSRVRSVTPYSLGLGFGMYVLSAFSGMFGSSAIEYITPFKHFDPAAIAQNKAYDTPLVLLNVAISLIALGISYWRYIRRDIKAVS